MQITLASKKDVLGLIQGGKEIDDYEITRAKDIKRFFELKLKRLRDPEKFLINGNFYFIIYSKNEIVQDINLNGAYVDPVRYEKEVIKTCSIYDKKLNFVKKGTLENMAKFLNIIPDVNYIDISNIKEKPELFLKIYTEVTKSRPFMLPQTVADTCLQDAKNGEKYAQFLVIPKHPVEIICQKEGISRAELSKKTGITVSLINNALSQNKCWDKMLEQLRKVYNYV